MLSKIDSIPLLTQYLQDIWDAVNVSLNRMSDKIEVKIDNMSNMIGSKPDNSMQTLIENQQLQYLAINNDNSILQSVSGEVGAISRTISENNIIARSIAKVDIM